MLDLVRSGLPISAAEFAILRRETVSWFHKQARRGAFDAFRIPGELGTKRYAGVKVQRWLDGEPIEADRTWAPGQKRGWR